MYRAIQYKNGYKVQRSADGKRWVNLHFFNNEKDAASCVEEYERTGKYVVDYSGIHFIAGLNGY